MARDERTREAIAEILDRSCLLLLANLLVFLLVGCSLETLPWKTTSKEVHENVTQGFQIVPTRLFASKMGVDTHVTRRTREGLALPVWDVLLRLGVTVLLGHTEVDDVNYISTLRAWSADEEVIGLDVAIDEVLLVDGLNPRQLYTGQILGVETTLEVRTICLATMTTVLIENFLLQWSNRSSKLGPSRSMTRMLCRPSWPK